MELFVEDTPFTVFNTPTPIPWPFPGPSPVKSISAGPFQIAIIDLEDRAWVFGENGWGQLGLGHEEPQITPVPIPGIKVKAISLGAEHTLIISESSEVYACGKNESGELGLDRRILSRDTPAKIPGIKARCVSAATDRSVIVGK